MDIKTDGTSGKGQDVVLEGLDFWFTGGGGATVIFGMRIFRAAYNLIYIE